MSGIKIQNHTDVTAGYQHAINGTQQYLGNRTLVLNGKAVTSKVVVSVFQAQIDAMQASRDAHTAWLQAVAKQRALASGTTVPMLAALRHFVAAMFGVGSDAYLAFGFVPPKPRTKSAVAKVIGAVKGLATRKARNTMGSKQRLGVTGAVPSTITLSVGNTPARPAQAAQPAMQAQPVPAEAVPAAGAQPAQTATVTTSTNGAGATHS